MKNDLHEMQKQPSQPEPTAQALAAAIAINTKTDAILKHMGVPTGPMDDECHRLTAQMIDYHAEIPMLLSSLALVRDTLTAQLLFWTKASEKTGTPMSKDMAELCRASIAIIDTATSTP